MKIVVKNDTLKTGTSSATEYGGAPPPPPPGPRCVKNNDDYDDHDDDHDDDDDQLKCFGNLWRPRGSPSLENYLHFEVETG